MDSPCRCVRSLALTVGLVGGFRLLEVTLSSWHLDYFVPVPLVHLDLFCYPHSSSLLHLIAVIAHRRFDDYITFVRESSPKPSTHFCHWAYQLVNNTPYVENPILYFNLHAFLEFLFSAYLSLFTSPPM